MTWTEIRSWAKTLGYETIKDKTDNQYYWAKSSDTTIDGSGVSPSVSKLARAIFNHHTNNKWVEHQEQYKEKLNGSSKIN